MTDHMPRWQHALERAQQMSGLQGALPFDPGCWDDQARARIIAITLYAQSIRDASDPATADLGPALWLLVGEQRWETQIAGILQTAGRLSASDDDPVGSTWAWLHQTWDPDAPPGQRWDGMTRGIARGRPDNAIKICLSWALGAVDKVLLDQRGGFASHSHVRCLGGDAIGLIGRVEGGAWRLDDEHQTIEPGPPPAYGVTFPGHGTQAYPAEDLTVADPADVPPPPVLVITGLFDD